MFISILTVAQYHSPKYAPSSFPIGDSIQDFFIVTKNEDAFRKHNADVWFNKMKLSTYRYSNVFLVRTGKETIDSLLALDDFIFASVKRNAIEELLVGELNIAVNKINTVHDAFPALTGNQFVLSIKENKPDSTDLDIRGRYVYSPLASSSVTAHATLMATIAAGAGNSSPQTKGPAWHALITSSSFETLLPDPDFYYRQNNITVQNHSYGTGLEYFYGADAAAYDASALNNPSLVHVFSAGNSGNVMSTSGTYGNLPGYANITGSFKMAKNIITVGHVDSLGKVLVLSSRGPAYDGRIKPELVAYGQDGSSGAAALVSGTAILLQQAFRQLTTKDAPSVLIRAALLNGADDVATPGIDYKSGYGNLNAFKSVLPVMNSTYYYDSVSQGQQKSFSLNVLSNIKTLKATISWNDLPAQPNASKALINDLDFSIVGPAGTVLPWVLNISPHIDSLGLQAKRKIDTLNNNEQITIDLPAAGIYQMRIHGTKVNAGTQTFALVFHADTLDHFKWYFPTASDNIFPNRINVLRWEANYISGTGVLEYRNGNGPWQFIASNVDLASGYYQWIAPDTISTAQLRMTVNGNMHVSAVFTISYPPNVKVAYNCPAAALLTWNKIPNATAYKVYRIGSRFPEHVLTVADTAVQISKTGNPHLYYAISPVINGKEGLRIQAIDYSVQGVSCYIRSFLVESSNGNVKLFVELSSVFNVKTIAFEKVTGGAFITIAEFPATGLIYTLQVPATNGANTFRVRVTLNDGTSFYSDPQTIFIVVEGDYLVFPNPVQQSASFTFLQKQLYNTEIKMYDARGVLVYSQKITDITTEITTDFLSVGVYFIRVFRDREYQQALKLVVR